MRFHDTHATTLALLAFLFLPTLALADEVQLQNGDRITGAVVRLAGGNLTFKAAGADLTIPWNTVTALTSTTTLRVRLPNQGRQTVTGITTVAPGQLMLTPGGQVAFADVQDIGPIEPRVTVRGGANAGFLNSSGNTDVFNLRLDADLALRQDANRYSWTAALNKAEDRGVNTARNWNTALNYDRFVTTRLFVNANAIFTNDRFRDLDLRTALGLGVGYQVFDTPVVKLTANGGLGWVIEDLILAPDNDYSAARESLALDITGVPNRILFFHKHDGYFGLAGDDNLFVKSSSGVRITVIRNFVTSFQFDLDYDPSPSPGRRSTDRTQVVSFGYRF
jgi:putative salt-induced outer membrane protein YdiY